MFEALDRQQVLADLRRRMGEVGAEQVGPALRPEVQQPEVQRPDESARLRIAPPPARSSSSLSAPAAGQRQLRRTSVIQVPRSLAGAIPGGGLPRGGVVSLAGGRGSSTLLLLLLAAPEQAWSAVVGLPSLGLLAGAELGLDLGRVAVIPDPGPDVLHVLSVLADGFDLIAVTAPPRALLTPARLRSLTGKLRQQGSALLVAGAWPGADLVLRTTVDAWTGLGQGHGRLKDRQLTVEVVGRRAGGRGRTASMLLRSDLTTVQILEATIDPAVAPIPVADAG